MRNTNEQVEEKLSSALVDATNCTAQKLRSTPRSWETRRHLTNFLSVSIRACLLDEFSIHLVLVAFTLLQG